MIIVSQAKDEIINFEKMNTIYVSKSGEVRACANIEDCFYVLGNYSTQERAKEVLQEIVKTYMLIEQYKVEDERTRIKLMMEGILLYEMPTE